MPKISIIIPTYNAEKFLRRTIESVLRQTYHNWEMLIIDDCSSDNTRKIGDEFVKNDSRVKYVALDKNSGGPAHPKNVGIELSSGRLIAFLDHDDEWFPEKLEKQVNYLGTTGLQFVTCDSAIIVSERKIGTYTTPVFQNIGEMQENMLVGNYVHSCSSVLFNREVFDSVGFFDERLKWSDDHDFYLRVLQRGYSIGVLSESLFNWHSQRNSAGKTLSFAKKAAELEYFLNKHRDVYSQNEYARALLLRHLGTEFVLGGQSTKGRSFYRVLMKDDFRLFVVFLFLLSFLGSPIFRFALRMRRKLSGKILDQT